MLFFFFLSFFLLIKLSFGGIPVPGKPGTFLKKNFQGCMENLYYNGINIIDLAKRRKHQIYTVVSWHIFGLVVSNPLHIPPLAPLHHMFIILLEAPLTSMERGGDAGTVSVNYFIGRNQGIRGAWRISCSQL